MAKESVKFKREDRSSLLGLGSLVLIGICTVSGFYIVLQQNDELKKANESLAKKNVELTQKNQELTVITASKDQYKLLADENVSTGLQLKAVTTLEAGASIQMVETGKGWIFLTRVKDGNWIGQTIDQHGQTLPTELSNQKVLVTNSVYIRQTPPSAPKFILGKAVGVARRGQYVSIGRVVEAKAGSWYGEVTKVSGSPSGDKSLGSGFFETTKRASK